MKTVKTKEKGLVIIFAIIFILICTLAGGTYLVVVTNECRQVEKELDSIKAFYLAQAGIEYGLWKIKEENP